MAEATNHVQPEVINKHDKQTWICFLFQTFRLKIHFFNPVTEACDQPWRMPSGSPRLCVQTAIWEIKLIKKKVTRSGGSYDFRKRVNTTSWKQFLLAIVWKRCCFRKREQPNELPLPSQRSETFTRILLIEIRTKVCSSDRFACLKAEFVFL